MQAAAQYSIKRKPNATIRNTTLCSPPNAGLRLRSVAQLFKAFVRFYRREMDWQKEAPPIEVRASHW